MQFYCDISLSKISSDTNAILSDIDVWMGFHVTSMMMMLVVVVTVIKELD